MTKTAYDYLRDPAEIYRQSFAAIRHETDLSAVPDDLAGLATFPACHAVLVNPLLPVPTPEVFRRLKKRDNSPMPRMNGGWRNLPELAEYLRATRNDLRDTAISMVPQIGEIEAQLQRVQNCAFARMSGSGATVFGLFATMGDARKAALLMRQLRPNDWISAVEICDSSKYFAAQ